MKKPFNIVKVLKEVEKAVAPYPKAAMFQLYEEGYTSVFEQLISCIISIRTLDETTIPVSKRLFQTLERQNKSQLYRKRTISRLIHGTTFAYQKANTILQIAIKQMRNYDGKLPADYKMLTSFSGVGPNALILL